jgi:hypothetical protein
MRATIFNAVVNCITAFSNPINSISTGCCRTLCARQQRPADKIRWMLGAKRLTTSGSSRLSLWQTAFASGLAADPRVVIKVFLVFKVSD